MPDVCFTLIFIVVPLLAILAVLLWFMNQSMDQDRIRGYLEFRGNRLQECKMQPAARDWWSQTVARSYGVRYLDADGHEHFATCVTGLFKGIVWTDDKFLRYADQIEGTPLPGHTNLKPGTDLKPGTELKPGTDLKAGAVEEENRRLREELARLKKKK